MRELAGYEGICSNKGKFVPVDEAFDYAAEKVGILDFDENAPDAAEFKDVLVEWFYSGNWIEVSDDGRD